MRTLFIAVCKVCGLLQVYTGLVYIASVLPIMRMLENMFISKGGAVDIRTSCGTSLSLTATSVTALFVLTFGSAWLLLFRAEWLADRLKVPENEGQSPLSGAVFLDAGVRLLGLFAIIQAAPDLIGKLGITFSSMHQLMSVRESMGEGVMERALVSGVWVGLVPPALKLVFGLLLALKSNSVINWITDKKEMTKPATP
jgi:hypothetical protein